jgi:serine/threonine-protein kinase
MKDHEGQRYGRYEILQRVGRGGMATVYVADDTDLHRQVAVKFLAKKLLDDTDAKDRFEREARAVAALDHPNICTIHEIGATEDGQPFIVMAYYGAGTLKDHMASGSLPLDEALALALQVAAGLAYAHEKDIAHRDVKPGNLLLTARGDVKIVDFGLAKMAGTDITRTGTIQGTPGYMSPEQALGEGSDHKTDIWALAVVLFEMVTGKVPFSGDGPLAVISAILHGKPRPLSEVAPELPAQLQGVFDRGLARDPDLRYARMAEFADDLEKLRGGQAFQTRAFESHGRSSSPSVAVLAFEDMSPDQDQAYFCDGIAEEMIGALGRVEGLVVAARTSSFQFKDKSEDVRSIGRQLGVASVLEGTVRKSGNQIRVTAHLVGVEDGYDIWSDRYDRELDDVFAIQDDITARVVLGLREHLLGPQTDADETLLLPRVVRPEKPETYTLYLRGRHLWNKRTATDLERGAEMFRQATESDPGYAPAWAGLADAYVTLGIYGAKAPLEVMPQARAAGERAAELDSSLAEALVSLACVDALFDWNWQQAEDRFRRAIELQPSYATAYQWLGSNCLAPQGRFDEALLELDRAAELDPVSSAIGVSAAWILLLANRFEEAEDRLTSVLEMTPDFALARFFLGRSHAAQAKWDEAVEELERALDLSGASSEVVSALGHTYAVAGQSDHARSLLESLLDRPDYVSPYLLAQIHCGLGEDEPAMEQLERAAEVRAVDLVWAGVAPAFARIATEPRVAAVLTEAGLSPRKPAIE